MRKSLLLIGYLALVLGGGLAIGYDTRPDDWYSALAKPAFNPPNWLFAPVWALLYVLIAISGARTWARAPRSTEAWLWWAALALNFLWSPTFFVAREPGLALVVVVAMLVCIVAYTLTVWPRDRIAAGLFVPYALWVAFAATLNASIWRLNPNAS
jgi:tryptophan-rich sensory protein